MVLCVESYIGEPGGREGVKLEQQIRTTPAGPELLSLYPLETQLLSRSGLPRRLMRRVTPTTSGNGLACRNADERDPRTTSGEPRVCGERRGTHSERPQAP